MRQTHCPGPSVPGSRQAGAKSLVPKRARFHTDPVHLAQLRLRDFRNYARLDVTFEPGFHLFLGRNAQGKTNVLEAIYLLATLRSFRGVGHADLVRFGQKGFLVAGRVVSTVPHDLRLYWSASERRLTVDGQPVRRLTDYLGTLRVVVFCAEDLLLVKGTARHRRRLMDLLLTQTQPDYLPLLQRYMRALRARNALLKQPGLDVQALESFTAELVTCGQEIQRRRQALVPTLAERVKSAYGRLTGGTEAVRLTYQPSVQADFLVALAQVRSRELARRTTLLGPHLDELDLAIEEHPAAVFASEGQKRTLALALKMAQAEYLASVHGAPPVLLIDDVMGELDRERRAAFLPLLERAHQARGQVFMTATEENWPRELGRRLQRWHVENGHLQRLPPV
jgi:DNA replication and repair protein RecF